MNKTIKHTPGEWAAEYCGKDTIKIFKASDKRRIATVKVKWMEMDEANAFLIAAAPDLLEAARMMVNIATHPSATKAQIRQVAEDTKLAIAKAEGRDA